MQSRAFAALALLLVIAAGAWAQAVRFEIYNYCPLTVIAKCAACTGFSCVPCGKADVPLDPGQSLVWSGVPNTFNGRVLGHPVIAGIDNSTYWDALAEFNFLDSGTFAGGAFFDMSYVDLCVSAR